MVDFEWIRQLTRDGGDQLVLGVVASLIGAAIWSGLSYLLHQVTRRWKFAHRVLGVMISREMWFGLVFGLVAALGPGRVPLEQAESWSATALFIGFFGVAGLFSGWLGEIRLAHVEATRRRLSGDERTGPLINAELHKAAAPAQREPAPAAHSAAEELGAESDIAMRQWVEDMTWKSVHTASQSALNFVKRTGGHNAIGPFENGVKAAMQNLRTALDLARHDSTVIDRFVEMYEAYFQLVAEAHRHVESYGAQQMVKREDYLTWCIADSDMVETVFKSAPGQIEDRLRQIGITSDFQVR